MNRRLFLQTAACWSALLALPKVAFAEGLKLIDLSGKKRADAANKTAMGIAQGLNYVEDVAQAAKEGKVKFPDKGGVKMADQPCSSCNFYTCVEGQKAGKCMLIPGVLVHAGGGCMSWVKGAKKACVKA